MKISQEARHILGRRGEDAAVRYLERRGYITITRNWRIKAGELDIVSFKDGKLIFIEVKTRTYKPGLENFRRLSLVQAKRNRAAAKFYWNALDEKPVSGNFDLIEIITSKRGFILELTHTEDYQIPFYPKESEIKIPQDSEPLPVDRTGPAMIFPCPMCRNPHSGKANSLCPECLQKIPFAKEDFQCLICGNELESPFGSCKECGDLPWNGAASIVYFTGNGAELVKKFKIGAASHLARTFSIFAHEFLELHQLKFDAVAAVPMPYSRSFFKMYNQAELFAERLAGMTGKKLIHPFSPILRRSKQSSLNRKEREKSGKNTYRLKSGCDLTGQTILLTDDIFTTGATMKAASRALRSAGAEKIYILTCAITPRLRKKH